jgi:hypothetical protein
MIAVARVVLFVLVATGFPARPAFAAEQTTVKHAVTQAKLFVRRGWFRDARLELEQAAASADGQRSFEVLWLLSQVCHELMDMGCALESARRAAPIVPDRQQADALEDLIRYYESTYGFLTIGAPYEGMVSRIQLELLTSLFDPELKRFVNRRALDLRERNPLPMEIALPAGKYRVNGHEIEVKANVEDRLVLPISALGARGMAALQVSRLEVTSGVGAFFGEDTADLQPGLDLQVAITQPFGPILVGLMVDHSLRNYVVPSVGPQRSRGATGIGFRIGREIPVEAPLGLRASLGYRFGYLPGIGFKCEQDPTGGLLCSDEPQGLAVLQVHGVARVHQPLVELGVEYRKAGRTTAFGSGVKFEVGYVSGAVPETTQVVVSGDSSDVREVTIVDGSIAAVSVRMLANLSFVF